MIPLHKLETIFILISSHNLYSYIALQMLAKERFFLFLNAYLLYNIYLYEPKLVSRTGRNVQVFSVYDCDAI